MEPRTSRPASSTTPKHHTSRTSQKSVSKPTPKSTAPATTALPVAATANRISNTKRPVKQDAVHFNVIIRLPFPRLDFIDPPAMDWDASKDKALWRILSRASTGPDINWEELADTLQVTLPFLLQQAAWLYERKLSQVRAQIRKVGSSAISGSPSPLPGSVLGSTNPSAQPMRRAGSGGGGARAPSVLSVRSRDSPALRGDGSVPSTPTWHTAQPMSRTTSANTATQSRPLTSDSPRRPTTTSRRTSYLQPVKTENKAQTLVLEGPTQAIKSPSSPSLRQDSSSSSSSSDSEGPTTRRGQAFRRPPSFLKQVTGRPRAGEDEDGDEEEDDEEAPAFLPFSDATATTAPAQMQNRPPADSVQPKPRRTRPIYPSANDGNDSGNRMKPPPSSASSASSQTPAQSEVVSGSRDVPLSPRRTAELSGRSPRRKGKAREGSDGTPSMGSSFSDLDDASVTQSALEEALMSNMQAGGVASRMSTISQAIRSRYL
ncbi:MAG: hypothetical protein M1825_003743 [Sarcosagium campestre]|nr:MAG: hypothetical protein M1825_003743 [Sarcosagium campestre]